MNRRFQFGLGFLLWLVAVIAFNCVTVPAAWSEWVRMAEGRQPINAIVWESFELTEDGRLVLLRRGCHPKHPLEAAACLKARWQHSVQDAVK